ncbi:MAG: B12-binding domain-containing radical SAM protein [Candidatus Omnitrophica bacterium]|nr:B12-binding domain-containing radical SAM protein [Candidatus Omnitrophota bacterium]
MEKLVYIIQAPPFWLKTPPLSLAYLQSYLQSKGINTGIIDLNQELFINVGAGFKPAPTKRWLQLDEEFEKNLFGMVEKLYPEFLEKTFNRIKASEFIGFSLNRRNRHFSFSLATKIKERYPEKKIIFGGPETLNLRLKSKLNPDYYWVIGEGEKALQAIIEKNGSRVICHQELDDLDQLPFYDFDNLDGKGPGRPGPYSMTIPLFSSRGCPHQCKFCTERLLYKKVRQHSVDYMIEQIKLLKSRHQTNSFVFLDSLINYRTDWLRNFSQQLIASNLNIKWEAQLRVDQSFPLEVAKLMKVSGCYNLFVGLESASDKVLAAMNKGFTAAEALTFLKTLDKAGLHFEISLIFGYPGEGKKEFQETINFIQNYKKLIPKIAQVNPYIDYFDSKHPEYSDTTQERVNQFLALINQERIPYTKSFINNLIYGN